MSGVTDDERRRLMAAAMDARNLSYCPYSKFRVGAAILCADGRIVTGANIENASYPAGICAERTAIPRALLEGHTPGSFRAVAVSGDIDAPTAPCGICRQVLREFCALDTPLYFPTSSWTASGDAEQRKDGQGGTWVTKTLEELLPMSFGPEDLERPRAPA